MNLGGAYQTSRSKYGAYSYYNDDTANNYDRFPVSLENALASHSAFTIEFWLYVPDRFPGTHSLIPVTRGNSVNVDNNLIFQVNDSTDWDPWGGTWANFQVGTTGTFAYGSSYPETGWHHFSIDWNGASYILYMDGTAIAHVDSNVNIFTVDSGATFGLASWFGNTYAGDYGVPSVSGLDRLIISAVDRGGRETIFGGCFSPTNTATITLTSPPTLTITPSFTMTGTSSMTNTATMTVTSTITGTVSATWTRTVTRTITQTATVTFTATWTVTPTATQTVSPTITLTVTPTSTRTWTPTLTQTGTNTATRTVTATMTRTVTAIITLTPTVTMTPTPSFTSSPANTQAATLTPSPTFTATLYILTQTVTPVATVGCPYGGAYDGHSIAAYEFENNGNDSSGNGYNLLAVNAGGSYQAGNSKYGQYSYYNNNASNNYDRFPAALETRLASLSSFTIEFWVYVPDRTPGVHSIIPVTRGGAGGLANNLLFQVKNSSDWSPWGAAWCNFQVGTTGIFLSSPAYPQTGWHHFSISWTGSSYNLYMDGSNIGNISSSINIFTIDSGATFGLASYFGNTYGGDYGVPAGSGLDKLIISDIDRVGAEAGYLSCYSPTCTPTITLTLTITMSPTSICGRNQVPPSDPSKPFVWYDFDNTASDPYHRLDNKANSGLNAWTAGAGNVMFYPICRGVLPVENFDSTHAVGPFDKIINLELTPGVPQRTHQITSHFNMCPCILRQGDLTLEWKQYMNSDLIVDDLAQAPRDNDVVFYLTSNGYNGNGDQQRIKIYMDKQQFGSDTYLMLMMEYTGWTSVERTGVKVENLSASHASEGWYRFVISWTGASFTPGNSGSGPISVKSYRVDNYDADQETLIDGPVVDSVGMYLGPDTDLAPDSFVYVGGTDVPADSLRAQLDDIKAWNTGEAVVTLTPVPALSPTPFPTVIMPTPVPTSCAFTYNNYGGDYEYIIITRSDLAQYFNAFAAWKTQKGIKTGIFTVDGTSGILNNYTGKVATDSPGRIRDFLQHMYISTGHKLKYVLMGGDTYHGKLYIHPVPEATVEDIVPPRYVVIEDADSGDGATDMYYSNIEPLDKDWVKDDPAHTVYNFGHSCAWDHDIYYIPGNVTDTAEGNAPYFHTTLYVGRVGIALPLEYGNTRTPGEQIVSFCQKAMDYEKTPGSQYVNKMLISAGNMDEDIASETYEQSIMPKLTNSRFNIERKITYPDCRVTGGTFSVADYEYWWKNMMFGTTYGWPAGFSGRNTTPALFRSITEGRHLWVVGGHSAPGMTYTENGENVSSTGIITQLNNSKYGVMLVYGCDSGAWDESYTLSEAFTNAQHGGGIGSTAFPRLDGPSSQFYPYMMSIYNNDMVYTRGGSSQDSFEAGKWLADSKYDFYLDNIYKFSTYGTTSLNNFCAVLAAYSWHGDPSLQLFTAEPSSLNVSISTGSILYDTPVNITVTVNVAGAKVCLSSNNGDTTDGIYMVKETGEGTSAVFSGVTVLNRKNIRVTVTKHNYIPFEGIITVSGGPTETVTMTWTCTATMTSTLTPTCTCGSGGSYDAHTVAVYNFENNSLDSSGNGYNMTAVNAGGRYQTAPVEQGAYSYYNDDSTNNYNRFPAALETKLAVAGAFTIEFWLFVPDKTPGTHTLIPVTRGGTGGLANNILLQINNSNNWDPWGGQWCNFQIGTTGIFIGQFSPIYPNKGWHRFGINWTGSRYNLYMDGIVIGHITSSVNVFTIDSGATFGLASYFGNTYGGDYGVPAGSGLDKLIISDIDRGTEETGYSNCFSPTVTPISSYNASTATMTCTATLSCTVTATPSPTMYITSSETTDITATSTATVTPDDTEVVTAAATASPSITLTCTSTPVSTNTPAPTQSGICLFDDAEDMNDVNSYGGFWYTYSGGTPATVWPAAGANLTPSAGGANGSQYAMRITGTVGIIGTTYPCIGMGSQITATSGNSIYNETDISSCTGIRFWVKGDGKGYIVRLPYISRTGLSLTGYNDYMYSFVAPASWSQLDISFSSFTQMQGWGTSVVLSDVLKHAKEFQWQTNFNAVAGTTTADLWVDDVYFYGCSSCPVPPAATNTPLPGNATATPTITMTCTSTSTVLTVTVIPTGTSTPTSIGTQVCLFDDAEDNDPVNAFGGLWYAYKNDPASVWPGAGPLTPTAGGANGSQYSMRITGTVGTGMTYPFIGMSSQLTASSGYPSYAEMNLNSCTGIRFWVKADAKMYSMRIPYTSGSGETLTLYDDYSYSFVAPTAWSQITVSFSSFTQMGWGMRVPMSDVLSHAKEIQWQTAFSGASADISLDDVYFYGCSSCPAAVNTQPPTYTFTPVLTFTSTPVLTNTIIPTFTPVVTPNGVCLFDNAEDMDPANSYGGMWYTFINGTPASVWPAIGANLTPSAGGANGSQYARRMTGTVGVAGTTYPFVGMGSQLSATSGSPIFSETNLGVCGGIRFWVKGDGKNYMISIPYTSNNGSSLTGYNDYSYSFIAPAAWTQMDVNFSSFTQMQGWGTAAILSDVLAHVKDVIWHTNFYAASGTTTADLSIDNVYLFGCSSCPPGLPKTSTPVPVWTETLTATMTPTITPTCTCANGGTYDSHTLAVYDFENNGNDINGVYNMLPVNAGGSYQGAPVESGSFSYYNNIAGNNYDRFPAALETVLAGSVSFTVEAWVYIPDRTPGVHSLIPITRGGTPGTADNLLLQIRYSTDWVPWDSGAWINFQVGLNSIFITSPAYPATGWHFFSIGWNGSTYRLYMDGANIGHIDSAVNVFTLDSGGTFGLGSYFGNTYGEYGIPQGTGLDKLIISNVERGGIETGYSSCFDSMRIASVESMKSVQAARSKVIADPISEKNTYNYPNPASGPTSIRFSVDKAQDVKIYVYSEVGKPVWYADLKAVAGINSLVWRLKNDKGNDVANGVYFLKVVTAGKTVSKKMAVIR